MLCEVLRASHAVVDQEMLCEVPRASHAAVGHSASRQNAQKRLAGSTFIETYFVLLFEIGSGLQLGSQEVPRPSDPPASAAHVLGL